MRKADVTGKRKREWGSTDTLLFQNAGQRVPSSPHAHVSRDHAPTTRTSAPHACTQPYIQHQHATARELGDAVHVFREVRMNQKTKKNRSCLCALALDGSR